MFLPSKTHRKAESEEFSISEREEMFCTKGPVGLPFRPERGDNTVKARSYCQFAQNHVQIGLSFGSYISMMTANKLDGVVWLIMAATDILTDDRQLVMSECFVRY